ncbi:prolipoprotein diacylglyceryl transferase [Geomonas sp. Red32]|uniref:prolipoprotein diacylglyceryl transferase family protein n=1 Tax=Geomonas sp. Red32 TaxID=2912856 RepID=UPI00202CFAC7|nr:prolipoprotein diacylglyceryl transferase family protein [Geomonas sp. Red32]MCM0083544.1 prolipoprotein diacylglyceryl transferase [Geomonas sp. Red32]
MTQFTFITLLAFVSALYLYWGIKKLPHERMQIAAAVPLKKDAAGRWQGLNLTWYGILTANAYVAAVVVALVLMRSAGISFNAIAAIVFLLLAVCVPASRLVAQVVEGKRNTFTVGGAVFVGTLVSPWVVELVNQIPVGDGGLLVPVLPALAAISIAYAFGEGYGRLACISFGCCYGKPLSSCRPALARIAAPFALVFTGSTKKIAYASGLEGVKVFPVQVVTYLLYTATGIGATALFLNGYFGGAFLLSLAVTQLWRVASEFLRDDYRGGGRISAYQWMGVIAVVYGCWAVRQFEDGGRLPDLAAGMDGFWSAGAMLLVQVVWVAIFLYTGLSRVTAATLSFHVKAEKI